jgi:hypothetical protein
MPYLYNQVNTRCIMALTLEADKEAAEITRSHELASEIRKLYGLQEITEKASVDVIKNLQGILKDFIDDQENPVDAVKASRENIHR